MKQKIRKQALNNTLDYMDITDIFRTFHANTEDIQKNTLSFQVHMDYPPG